MTRPTFFLPRTLQVDGTAHLVRGRTHDEMTGETTHLLTQCHHEFAVGIIDATDDIDGTDLCLDCANTVSLNRL